MRLRKSVRIFLQFVTVFLILFFILNYLFNSLVLPTRFNGYKENYYYSNISNINMISVGDSHTAFGLNPIYIPGLYNFAIGGETHVESYYKLRGLQKEKNFNVIIINANLFSFSKIRSDQAKFIDAYYWKEYVDDDTLKKFRKDDSSLHLFLNKNFPMLGDGKGFLGIWFNKVGVAASNGWQRDETVLINSKNKTNVINHRFEEFYSGYDSLDPVLLNYFEKMLEFADNDTAVIVIMYPKVEELVNLTLELPTYNSDMNRIRDVVYSYNNTYLLNYTEIEINQSYFSDPTHMNIYGSEFLSKKVNDFILENNLN